MAVPPITYDTLSGAAVLTARATVKSPATRPSSSAVGVEAVIVTTGGGTSSPTIVCETHTAVAVLSVRVTLNVPATRPASRAAGVATSMLTSASDGRAKAACEEAESSSSASEQIHEP